MDRPNARGGWVACPSVESGASMALAVTTTGAREWAAGSAKLHRLRKDVLCAKCTIDSSL